jgi:proteasome accessory factor C
LLALVPYLLAHPGVQTTEAARHFAITEQELVRDLELLFVCGLPGHLPDDLIEAEWESGRVYLANADAIARPLRLGLDEAVTLLVGLRILADAPGAADLRVVGSAMATITEASGLAAESARSVEVTVETTADAGLAETLNTAARDHHRLALTYLVASRDEKTDREVAPIRVLAMHGHWYLEAWCHGAQGVRVFRFDRIQAARRIDGDGHPPPQAAAGDLSDRLFQPAPGDDVVVLDLHPRAAWVIDYYSADVIADTGHRQTVQVRSRCTSWVIRLALRLGGDLVVRGPDTLLREVQKRAESALRAADA